jgi:GxxExxY protein
VDKPSHQLDGPIAKIDLSKLLLGDETYQIVGAAMEVYYKLGTGFLEPVYQQALAIELKQRSILFEQEKRFQIDYKGTILEKEYVADFVCFDQVIVEIKALNQLSPVDWSQVLNYLKVSRMRVGLLFNFGSVGRLEWKRLVI